MKNYKVIKTINETPDVKTIYLADGKTSLCNFNPGQYITVQLPNCGVPEGKAYSISSLPSDPFLSITVKEVGLYSKKLCSLVVGDTVTASEPYGYLFEDTGQSLVCMAAGVGISPIWSVIRSVLNNDNRRSVDLYYSNKTINDIVFRDAIFEVQKSCPNFKVSHYITREEIDTDDVYHKGRFNSVATAQKIISDNASVLICGGQEFVTDMYKQLTTTGVSSEQISAEVFFMNFENK